MIRYIHSIEYRQEIEKRIKGRSEADIRAICRKTATELMIHLFRDSETDGKNLADMTVCIDMLRKLYNITDIELEREVKRVLAERNCDESIHITANERKN